MPMHVRSKSFIISAAGALHKPNASLYIQSGFAIDDDRQLFHDVLLPCVSDIQSTVPAWNIPGLQPGELSATLKWAL